ncbi:MULTISPECIES: LysR family transcriptional regulator [Pseudomonas]|uniref:LysR family transcriptional regulator n=1 Tax=Pseudomonas TaxID=286 RepID=UPI00101299EE|nr:MULTISPECIES: LysR family transcriptional regulator [Pseudomonas]MBC8878034.1 LysR family transcriptional regulator [Pseudomonas cerasi]RXT90632.1 transcriptional regulator [Pseudomonas syringae]
MRHDLLSLEIFMAVAEQRNLTRAAERCHLATSAVSKRISELEAKVGASLFVRYPRGMELTPAGQSLRHYTVQLMETLGKMDSELEEYGSGTKGHIRLHAITSALAQHLTIDVGRFLNSYPEIKFDIEERVGAAIVRAVADGRADLGIIAEQTPAMGLESIAYRTDELVVAVSETHPLAQFTGVRFEQALGYEFIGPHQESSVHNLLTEHAGKLGTTVRQRIRVSSFECMCQMASANLGICILPRDVLRRYLKPLHLHAIALEESWAHRQLNIVSRSFEALAPTAKAFVGHLTA